MAQGGAGFFGKTMSYYTSQPPGQGDKRRIRRLRNDMAETSTSRTNGADGEARARLSFDLDVDICIVGAGLAGLTVALEAARLGASIAVLEGRHVGWNASGHH